jgi:hypothetical protein
VSGPTIVGVILVTGATGNVDAAAFGAAEAPST